MASNPTTSACENIIVAYGNGAAPRNKANVVTSALRGRTCFDSHAKSDTPPNAVTNPSDPAHATQLENSHPTFESGAMPASDKTAEANAKGTNASATVPGALSL